MERVAEKDAVVRPDVPHAPRVRDGVARGFDAGVQATLRRVKRGRPHVHRQSMAGLDVRHPEHEELVPRDGEDDHRQQHDRRDASDRPALSQGCPQRRVASTRTEGVVKGRVAAVLPSAGHCLLEGLGACWRQVLCGALVKSGPLWPVVSWTVREWSSGRFSLLSSLNASLKWDLRPSGGLAGMRRTATRPRSKKQCAFALSSCSRQSQKLRGRPTKHLQP